MDKIPSNSFFRAFFTISAFPLPSAPPRNRDEVNRTLGSLSVYVSTTRFLLPCYGGLALSLRIRLLREARNDGKYGHCEGADLILFEFRSPRQHPWQSVVSRIQPSFSTAFISTKDLRFRSGSGCSLRQAQGPMMGFFIPALNQVSSMQKC